MRRNLGSEVLIAVGALSVIICGLFFALLLSSDGDDTVLPNTDGTSIVESNTDDAVSTTDANSGSKEATDTPEPTEIDTDTPEPTATDTDVPEPTETETEIPTDEPTQTDTVEPSPTLTIEIKATATDEASNTPRPTETDTETPTDEPTETATKVIVATDTPQPEPSATDAAMPSETPDASSTPTAISTLTDGFVGIIPPPSPTVSDPNEPTRTPASCDLPNGWTSYVVQSGDTLFAISLVTSSTVDELRFANCIDDIDNITAGDSIFVPIAPIRPVSTTAPSEFRQGLGVIGCTSSTAQITSPILEQRVRGTFTVYGTATHPDFQYYKIEVRPDFAQIYNFYSDSTSQVTNGTLGQINAELFGPGLHWVRLTVVDRTASIPTDGICEIPVFFE